MRDDDGLVHHLSFDVMRYYYSSDGITVDRQTKLTIIISGSDNQASVSLLESELTKIS